MKMVILFCLVKKTRHKYDLKVPTFFLFVKNAGYKYHIKVSYDYLTLMIIYFYIYDIPTSYKKTTSIFYQKAISIFYQKSKLETLKIQHNLL